MADETKTPTPTSTTGSTSARVEEGKSRQDIIERTDKPKSLSEVEPGTEPEELAKQLGIEIENMPDTGELADEGKPEITVDYDEGAAKPYVVLSNDLVAARFATKEEALSNATRFANPVAPARHP